MSYNDKLKSDIIVAKVSINALETQLKTIAEDVQAYRETIKLKLRRIIDLYESAIPFIPSKMKESIEFLISDSTIRPRWKDYEREGYTNQLDIYYYPDNHYSNRNSGNHSWEISCSSMKMYINTIAEKNQAHNETLDRTLLAIGMNKFIEDNKVHLIELHKEWSDNESKAWELSSAIDKLKRDITDAERQMETNDLIRMVKPGGETAIYLFNKDIPMFTNSKYQYSRRYSCWFDAIRLVKETKKGVKVQFLCYNKNEGVAEEHRSWVTETKVVDFQTLIGILRSSKSRFEYEEKRRAEKEKREQERAAAELELKTRTV